MKLFINEKQRKNTENLKIPRFNTSSLNNTSVPGMEFAWIR